jgi:hypothetical protein
VKGRPQWKLPDTESRAKPLTIGVLANPTKAARAMGDPAIGSLAAPAAGDAGTSQLADQGPQPTATDDAVSADSGGDSGTGGSGGPNGGASGGSGTDQGSQQGTANELNVHYDLPLITQPDGMTCWAAALAMIQSYRDQASYGVDDFAGPPPHRWMTWSQIEPIALNLGFTEIASADLTTAGWRDLLAAHGPLWIVVKSAVSNASSHAVVLVGISGDGSPEGTQMTSNNPAGTVDQQPFTSFADAWDFGAVAGASIFAPQ